ncbi:MAG: helix-hairpin-helix domain-containing protein [Thermoplasmatota archaeon]
MELEDIPKMGPVKAEKLRAAGITTVQQIAELDLRKKPDLGVNHEMLKGYKQAARKMIKDAGGSFSKAAYGDAPRAKPAAKPTNGSAAKPAAKAKPAAAPAATVTETAPEAPAKGGLFKRLFGRRD